MKLHDYQKRIANFIARTPCAILSVDMGLGKTAAVLAWLDWAERRVGYTARVAIIAPKRVAENQWRQEMEKWGYTDLARATAIVKGKPDKRAAAIASAPIIVISRDNLKDIERTNWDAVILDELTSFKNPKAKRTQIVCGLKAPRRIGLTGTFLANGAVDVYGQTAAVGLTRKFGGMTFYQWRATYFRDALAGSGLQFQKWKLNVPLPDLLHPLSGNIYTLTASDYLEIPPVTETTHKIKMTGETRKAISDLDSFLSMELNGEVLSFDEAQKFAKLQTLCNGFVYVGEDQKVARGAHSDKLEAVADFVEDCRDAGEPVLLFYAFREEEKWLKEMLDARKIKTASVRDDDFMRRWNDGEIEALLAHPASAGHGLNLQHGGRVIVWSTLTYNYEYFAQANARLARQGQTRNVQIHYFVADDTCEVRAVAALQAKDKDQKKFLQITKQ